MSVIIELSLPSEEFELGRILQMNADTHLDLETLVPLGNLAIPFFRVYDGPEAFEQTVTAHPAVESIQIVSTRNGETLYALDWQVSEDSFFQGLISLDAHVLEGRGTIDAWGFELRFPTHDALSAFQDYCFEMDIPINVKRIYNPTKPDAGPWYGLTTPQREMLIRAVEAGYYSIPRQSSTVDLAREVGISDQAVTERLRRAIETLVTNTLLLAEHEATIE